MNRIVKSLLVRILLFGCALLVHGRSFAQDQQQSVQVFLDGKPLLVPLEARSDGKVTTWSLAGGPLNLGGEDGGVLDSLTVTANPDPFLGYAIGLTDIGAPSIFGFAFGTPIVPTSPPGTVTSGFSASLTDGPTGGGVSITPAAPGVPVDGDGIDEIHVVTDGFASVGGLINDGRDLGPAGAFGAGTSVHGPFNEVGPLAGPGPWTWLQINVTFLGSGGSDFYGLTGSAIKAEGAVPETGSTLLVALLGLAGCAIGHRFAPSYRR